MSAAAALAGADMLAFDDKPGASLLQALDLNRPGLKAVRQAVTSGSTSLAVSELARYLRARERPRWHVDPANPPKSASDGDMRTADQALQHTFSSVGIEHTFGTEIDWGYNPTTQPGSPHAADHEWTWQLNRHAAWISLARAYNKTGDARYGKELAQQIADWILRNPPPEGHALNSPYSRWRTIEAGIRMFSSWPEVYFRMLRSPDVFPDDVLLAMVDCMGRHAEYLDAYPTRGNWLCMEANGQFHVGVLFPEFKNAERWRTNALARLRHEIDAQVYPDGAQIELTPGYHNVSLRNFVGALRLAQLNDIALPEGYQAGLERMYDLNMRAMSPDRDVPPLNDSWPLDVPSLLAEGHELFPNRKDWEWIATDGKSGQKPSFTSVSFPYAGWAVMRSGWERDARFLMMECGPFGLGHQHEDKLSFVLHAFGTRLVFDAGSYAYDASDMRRYVLSARGHNVIHVDGMEQNRRGGPHNGYVVQSPVAMAWRTDAQYDFAAGSYGTLPEETWGPDRKRGIVHTRRVLFVKPDWWIVCDSLEPSDSAEHLYESTFHLDAPAADIEQSSLRVDTKRDGANLAILPAKMPGLDARIVSGQTEPFLQGWLPRAHGRTGADPRPCVYYSVKAAGAVHLCYVFAPYAAGKACPVASVRPRTVPDARVALQITLTRGRVCLFALMLDGTVAFTPPDGKEVSFRPIGPS
jgi:hypothetical protein